MSYKTFWEANGIKWVFSGTLTNGDLLQCNKELYNDSRFLDLKYELCDFTAVEKFPVDSDVIRQVAEMDSIHSRRNPNIRVAIITGK